MEADSLEEAAINAVARHSQDGDCHPAWRSHLHVIGSSTLNETRSCVAYLGGWHSKFPTNKVVYGNIEFEKYADLQEPGGPLFLPIHANFNESGIPRGIIEAAAFAKGLLFLSQGYGASNDRPIAENAVWYGFGVVRAGVARIDVQVEGLLQQSQTIYPKRRTFLFAVNFAEALQQVTISVDWQALTKKGHVVAKGSVKIETKYAHPPSSPIGPLVKQYGQLGLYIVEESDNIFGKDFMYDRYIVQLHTEDALIYLGIIPREQSSYADVVAHIKEQHINREQIVAKIAQQLTQPTDLLERLRLRQAIQQEKQLLIRFETALRYIEFQSQ